MDYAVFPRWFLAALATTVMAAEPVSTPPEECGGVAAQAVDEGTLRPFTNLLKKGSGSVADDAGLMLAYLNAGYDHKTPSKHKLCLAHGVWRLSALDPASLDLPVHALVTTVLAEALAMTADPELRPRVELLLELLVRRWPDELPLWQARSGAFSGPDAVVLVAKAFKAGQAGGLEVGGNLASLCARDLGHDEAAELARAYLTALTGGKPPFINRDTAQRWMESFDRWWKAGQTGRLEMAAFVALRDGGEGWQLFKNAWPTRLEALRVHGGADDGWWPLEHHPLGKLHGTTQVMLCLEIFYRATP